MTASKKRASADIDGWNLYVEGTIAFLENDRAALDRAAFDLKALKRPPGLSGGDGLASKPFYSWNVGKCFGSPYKKAYGGGC
jgi:hypothetical protein